MNVDKSLFRKSRLSDGAIFVVITLSMVLFVACGSDGYGTGTGSEETGEQRGSNEVWMEDTSFNPQNLEVGSGTTVTWTNKSSHTHTVTSGNDGEGDDLFNSGNLSEGQSFSYTFNRTGNYSYFCENHSGMTGVITVVEAGDY